jgi:hypothetical protein
MSLADPGAEDWILHGPLEERIVSYADKRATQRVVSMEQRFERWRRRHPEHLEQLERAFDRALLLERELCATIDVRAEGVERLRWVEQARDHAAANGRLTGGEAAAAVPSRAVEAAGRAGPPSARA